MPVYCLDNGSAIMMLDGREVIDAEVDGVDTHDYPDFADAYFSRAFFADNGEELTESQLERLAEKCSAVLYQMALDQCGV